MKKFLVSCLVAVIFFSAAAQKDGFCETYVFHGTLQTGPESAAGFTLNFLVLSHLYPTRGNQEPDQVAGASHQQSFRCRRATPPRTAAELRD